MIIEKTYLDGSISLRITLGDMYDFCSNEKSSTYDEFCNLMYLNWENFLYKHGVISFDDCKYLVKED